MPGEARNPTTIRVAATPTIGLLVSMCMRQDHGFFAATPEADGSLRMWLTEAERSARMDAMRAFHAAALAHGEPGPDGTVILRARPGPSIYQAMASYADGNATTASQLWEELSGRGFWSPERDAGYAAGLRTEAVADAPSAPAA